MSVFKRIILSLVIIGAINWGLIGLFQFDLVAAIFGGQTSMLSRLVYTLVGISGILSIGMLFSPMEDEDATLVNSPQTGKVNYSTEFGEETTFKDKE